jgi:hypothetical protein
MRHISREPITNLGNLATSKRSKVVPNPKA